jgi:hypothetical protein
MNEADEKALYMFRDDCKTNIDIFKHDRTYDRNKLRRLQVVYRYLNDKLNQYETLKKEGKLILAGDIQPSPALEQLKVDTFQW